MFEDAHKTVKRARLTRRLFFHFHRYSRDWRWHKKLQQWMMKAKEFGEPQPLPSQKEERGYYYFFDVNNWRRERVSLLLLLCFALLCVAEAGAAQDDVADGVGYCRRSSSSTTIICITLRARAGRWRCTRASGGRMGEGAEGAVQVHAEQVICAAFSGTKRCTALAWHEVWWQRKVDRGQGSGRRGRFGG